MFGTPQRRILIVTAVLATGVPVGAALWIDAATAELTDDLGTAGR